MTHHANLDIAVFGSINADLVAYFDSKHLLGTYTVGTGFEFNMGGKSLNVAKTLFAIDPSVALIGRVGADVFGREITSRLCDSGMRTEFVIADSTAHTGIGHVKVNVQGEYDTVVVNGANDNLVASDFQKYTSAGNEVKFVVLNLEAKIEVIKSVADHAHSIGAKVIINLSPIIEHAHELIKYCDIAVVNYEEARALTAEDELRTGQDLAKALIAKGAKAVVLTLGKDGVCGIDPTGRFFGITGQDLNVVNSVGAGDSFLAVFVAAIATGYELEIAAQIGNEAGKLACMRSESYLEQAQIDLIEKKFGITFGDKKARMEKVNG
jgi:ribokinase